MQQVKCTSCGFPIATSGSEGDSISCPSCRSTGILKRIGQVIVPTPMFFGIMGFTFGLILGPVVKRYLEKVR